MKNLDWEKLAFEFQTTSISLTEMGKREKVDRRTLAKYFKELGIEIVNKQNRSKFNEHVFDQIDSEEKAYWLGFIFADGYISSSPLRENVKSIYQFELSLGLKDKEHLEKFRNFMEYEKPLLIDTCRCRFTLANKHLWTTLNSYGCTPNKSLTLTFPNIPEYLIKHFIRGYFDGDGCITRYVHKTCVSPHIELLGTKQMLEQILIHSNTSAKYKHDKRHSEETWSLEWSKQEGIDFINYLYQNCSIYLNRKYELYQFFKNGSRSVEEFTELLSGKNGECLELES
jgi:intein-encoded DNA endonuclease-like protein